VTVVPRTLPTRLGAEDKLIDLYLVSLTVCQVLNVLGGLAAACEVLSEPILAVVPLPVRQVLAALAILTGIVAAFWRHDGRSLWAWLWAILRFSRLARRAISRRDPVSVDDRPDPRSYEVRPPLSWPDGPSPRRIARRPDR
jgi:hypothetical protein